MDLHICRICGGMDELKEILEQDAEMVEKLLECANIRVSIKIFSERQKLTTMFYTYLNIDRFYRRFTKIHL